MIACKRAIPRRVSQPVPCVCVVPACPLRVSPACLGRCDRTPETERRKPQNPAGREVRGRGAGQVGSQRGDLSGWWTLRPHLPFPLRSPGERAIDLSSRKSAHSAPRHLALITPRAPPPTGTARRVRAPPPPRPTSTARGRTPPVRTWLSSPGRRDYEGLLGFPSAHPNTLHRAVTLCYC